MQPHTPYAVAHLYTSMPDRRLKWDNYGLNINGVRRNYLRFADDLIMISEDSKRLQKMLEQRVYQRDEIRLSMNTVQKAFLRKQNQKAQHVAAYLMSGGDAAREVNGRTESLLMAPAAVVDMADAGSGLRPPTERPRPRLTPFRPLRHPYALSLPVTAPPSRRRNCFMGSLIVNGPPSVSL
ncbi:hypothetical protein EVAR_64651_1 [Eumeta japonica]|uniref:Reverse transcriptase domain-containing protein n=1 Tax=Eumeta variegata TaxID=151549 RepID=A0A4C1ZEH1_EUMVA|nr:hypothetical protein EVAR_64651_1 [Eumeta japonica]